MEKTSYGGWENCYRLANDLVEVVVTGDVGPRVIRLAAPGGRNLFAEFGEMMGLTGGDDWRIYGGHRLWHAPESRPRTYHPDNEPVRIEPLGGGLRAFQTVESSTGIEKQIDISLCGAESCVSVVHRLINHNLWPVALSVWALSAMAPGGVAIIPQPPYQAHGERLDPSHPLVLWPYTRMDDVRWRWGGRYIRLRQDPAVSAPLKIGTALTAGRVYYALEDFLFVKQFTHVAGASYPDFGCSFETFTDDRMLELESLGPLTELHPGECAEHTEHWHVLRGVRAEGSDEQMEGILASAGAQIGELEGKG